MTSPLRILCVGLTPADLDRLRAAFSGDAEVELGTADAADELRHRLAEPEWRLVVAEYSSHRGGGPEALRLRNEIAPRLPFVFVAESLDAEAAIAAVKAGATDLALFAHHRRLRDVLEQAVDHRAGSRAAPVPPMEEELGGLAFRHLPDAAALFSVEPGGRYVAQAANAAFSALLPSAGHAGAQPQQWRGKTLRELVALAFPFGRNLFEAAQQRFLDAALSGKPATFETEFEAESGARHQEQVIAPIFDAAGRCRHLLWTFRDITSRRRAEAESRRDDARLREANLALLSLARSRNFHGEHLIEALREITETAGKAVGVARSSVWLYNHARSKIRCIDLWDARTGSHSEGSELHHGDHPSYFLSLEAQRLIAAHDALADSRTREYGRNYLTPLGISSMLDAAVRLRGELVGVICLEHVGPPRRWSSEEELFAVALADVVSLALEASERERAEAELRESQQKLRLLVRQTPLAVIQFDTDFRIADWNPAAQAIFGHSAFEALGRHGLSLFAEEAKEEAEANWRRLLAVRGGVRCACRCVRQDGGFIECEWHNTPLVDEEGRVVGVASLVMDVTERLAAERALRASEERFQKAFMHSPMVKGISRLRDRRCLAVNEACLRLTGLTSEQAVGKTLAEMGISAPPGLPDRLYGQLARGSPPPPEEIALRLPSGEERVGLVSAVRIDSEGEPCVLWAFQDLTALRHAEAELRAARGAPAAPAAARP